MDNFNRDSAKLERNGNTVNRLDVMVCAMWELMLEKGYTREQLNAKLDKVKEQKITLDPQLNRVVCPACGKSIGEVPSKPFEGKCIYCGHTLAIYPGDSVLFEKDSESLPADAPSTIDGQDQF